MSQEQIPGMVTLTVRIMSGDDQILGPLDPHKTMMQTIQKLAREAFAVVDADFRWGELWDVPTKRGFMAHSFEDMTTLVSDVLRPHVSTGKGTSVRHTKEDGAKSDEVQDFDVLTLLVNSIKIERRAFIDEICGFYENLEYTGEDKNTWHFVEISPNCNGNDSDKCMQDWGLQPLESCESVVWKNRAGVVWTLSLIPPGPRALESGTLILEKLTDSANTELPINNTDIDEAELKGLNPECGRNMLLVHSDCCYYSDGHEMCEIERDPNGVITALFGPWNEIYSRRVAVFSDGTDMLGTEELASESSSEGSSG